MNIRKLTLMQSRQNSYIGVVRENVENYISSMGSSNIFLEHLYFFVPFLPFRTFLLYFFQFCTFTLSVTLMRVTKLSIRFQQVDLLQTIEISAVLFWSIFVELNHVFMIWLIDSEKVTEGFLWNIKTGALHRLRSSTKRSSSMLVANVGDTISWWYVKHFGDQFMQFMALPRTQNSHQRNNS